MTTLDRIRIGDVTALEELLQETWSALVCHLTVVSGSADAAQDAAQEAFVRLWERRGQWSDGSARALVFRIGRNLALDGLRRQEVRARWARRGEWASPKVPTPEDDLEGSEVRAAVRAAIEGLPPRRREIFELVRFAGLTYQEVADALELSPQTVANHLSLALGDLRTALSGRLAGREPDPGERPGRRYHDA